jgi:uncharacterized protein YfaS (alpha-2-macroglobulin family)
MRSLYVFRILYAFKIWIAVVSFLVVLELPCSALSIPELESPSQAYLNSLKTKYGVVKEDARRRLEELSKASRDEDWSKAVRQLEELTGRSLAGQSIPGSSASDLLYRLGEAWSKHQPAADEGLWAAYAAQTLIPRNRATANVAALVVMGEVLLAQINALRADFDYREVTLGQIAEKLGKLDYGAARIALEDGQGRLPSEVRELLDLKAREERERMMKIDQITGRMALANLVYQELAKTSQHEDLGDRIKEAIDQKLFYVRHVYSDARRTTAAICLEFNLPLRPDAGEYQDMIEVIPVKPDPTRSKSALVTERTVRDTTLCLHGLRHGESYHVVAKKGLPSKFGAQLLADFDTRVADSTRDPDEENGIDAKTGITIPNRKATAGFRSAAFILPKFGTGSIPLMTVNVERVDLELVRLSDRTLFRPIALGQIGNDIDQGEFRDIKGHFSDAYWKGGIDLQPQPNETVTTEIPIRQLLTARNEFLSSIRDKLSDQPLTSEMMSAGPARGHFRVDKLSAGGTVFRAEEPGVYALLAKTHKDFNGDDDDPEKNAALDKSDALAEDPSGIYVAREIGDSDCKDQESGRTISCRTSVQWFVLTDIGLSYYMGPEALYVIARSLSTGKPLRDVKIQLVAANNRVLVEGETDASGIANFNSRLTRGTQGNRLAAVTAYQDNDFSFVNFSRDVFDLSDYGTAGRKAPRFFDAFVYSDRGVYRPEETIHATVLVRDPEGDAPARIPPVTVKIRASNGKIIEERQISTPDWQLGGASIDLSIPANASLGQADILVYLGDEKDPIGATNVQLDHFRPDRARISFVRDADWRIATSPDQTVAIHGFADAQYLYGVRRENSVKSDAPAANLTAEVTLLMQPAASPFPGCYGDFKFGRIESDFTPVLHRVLLPNRSEANGDLAIETTARLPRTDLPLQGRFTLTLFDEGGKVGQQSKIIPIAVDHQWLGVRQETRLLPARDGVFLLKLAMVALDAKGQLRSTRLKYRLWRERNVFIWHQDSSSWRYQPDVQRTLVKEDTVLSSVSSTGDGCRSANALAEIELPLGRYYVEVIDDAGPKVTFRQDAGWSGAGLHAPTPDRALIFADAQRNGETASYQPGAIATFSVEAPFDGEVLLAIANDRVHLWDTSAATQNRQATVKIKIDPLWAGNAFYALATVFRRNADDSVERGPARAVGATYFTVDREAQRRIKLTIDKRGLDQIPADKPLSINLRAEGIDGRAWATVYAVDEGLISLNDHPSPDPFEHFFGRRALGLEVLDNYGRILLADRGRRDRSGGDRSRRLFLTNYTSDKIVAQFTGPVEFVNGVATVKFEKPFDFNGTVRIAAVAWTEKRVGAATDFIVSRQPIVANLNTPRFLTPGDRATIGLRLSPVDVMPGRYRISLSAKTPLVLESIASGDKGDVTAVGPGAVELNLSQDDSRLLNLTLRLPPDAKQTSSTLDLRVEGAQAIIQKVPPISRSFDIAIRPSEAPTTDVAFVTVQPNETMQLSQARVLELASRRFVDRGLSVKLFGSTDPLSVVRLIGGGARDPQVGMLERLVWRGMMMFGDAKPALANLVRQVEALQTKEGYFVGYRLVSETGLEESQQIFDRSNDPVGQFERHEIWRTALALDFLLQARSTGIQISDSGLQLGLTKLRDIIRKALQDGADMGSYSADDSKQDEAKTRLSLMEDKDAPSGATGVLAATPRPVPTKRHRSAEMVQKLLNGETADQKDTQPNDDNKKGDDQKNSDQKDGDQKDADQKGDADVNDSSKPYERQVDACDEDLLYATYVLARSDSIDRFDLVSLMKYCSQKSLRPLGAAMLAAALTKFGALEEAHGVLVSIEARAGAVGDGVPNSQFDAMMLAFLALADASSGLKSELVERLTAPDRSLSLATRAWLTRAYAESTAAPVDAGKSLGLDVEGQLKLETHTDRELLSEPINVSDLAARSIGVRNSSAEPLTVALLLTGIPKKDAAAPSSGIKISRRIVNQKGEDVDLQKARLRPNDLLYILLSGQRDKQSDDDDAMRSQDPIVIVDRLPAAFEIVDNDIFEFARSDGVSLRAVLPSDGKLGRLRVAEARDDQFLAIVKPTSTGDFQIGYSVRVLVTGQFIQPGTIVEDLYRSDEGARLQDTTVQVEGRGRP